jgi:hypothetical protein
MNKDNKSTEIMWENYLKSIGENLENTEKKYISWCFGYGNELSKELSDLKKRE